MKDHKREARSIDLEGTVDDVIDRIRVASEGLINPEIEIEYGYDYESDRYYINGWRPMTAGEKVTARKVAAALRKANKVRKEKMEADERKEAISLLKKYPDIIKDMKGA